MERRNGKVASHRKVSPVHEYSLKCGTDDCLLDSLYCCNICAIQLCIRHRICQENNTSLCHVCVVNPDYRDSIVAVNLHYRKKTILEKLFGIYKIITCRYI